MTNLEEVIRGLKILKDQGAGEMCAGHDIIYADAPKEICSNKTKELKELNWFWDDSVGTWAKFV